MDFDKDPTLQEWTREQPLAVLALDSADRAVLRIAGMLEYHLTSSRARSPSAAIPLCTLINKHTAGE